MGGISNQCVITSIDKDATMCELWWGTEANGASEKAGSLPTKFYRMRTLLVFLGAVTVEDGKISLKSRT